MKNTKRVGGLRSARWLAMAAAVLALSACGGGGDEEESQQPPEQQAPANRAPTISGSPATSVQAGSTYQFQPSVSDPDGDDLSFQITNKPSWADFNENNGRLSGVPGDDDVGPYDGITIRVSDGSLSATLTFSIQVTSGPVTNQAPTISGTPPASINVGGSYSFRPNAQDPDGDPLSFTVENLPDWATFNENTGRISGSPDSQDIGSYPNIVITVSDGELTASLGPFTIDVHQISTGSATVSWVPPTENTDGSALTDLAGYRIYYGTSPTSMTQSVQVNDPGATVHMISNLAPATWYFTVRAYNSAGVESDPSNTASKTIM